MGPVGATGQSWPAGSNGPPGPSNPYVFVNTNNQTNAAISFTDQDRAVLTITKDGDVVWGGKPSKAADVLEQTLGNMIDGKAASASMRQRTYMRACQSLLSKARNMTKEEFIAHLEESIANRNSKVVLLALDELSAMEEDLV
jgi:hypothetical protein